MSWTAIIPLNAPTKRKSRLSTALGASHRELLAVELYRHVLGCVEAAGIFETILTLSPSPAPVDLLTTGSRAERTRTSAAWWLQQDNDLNADFARARGLLSGPLLVLNADLPLLAPAELLAFVETAEASGCALAADRHGTGTNAVALLPGVTFRFSFGPDSLASHLRAAPWASVVVRTGLACDLDTPADIDHLLASGHPLPDPVQRLMHADRIQDGMRHVAHAD